MDDNQLWRTTYSALLGAAVDVAKHEAVSAAERVASTIRNQKQLVLSSLPSTLERYTTAIIERWGKAKTLLHPHDQKYLYEFFEPVQLKHGEKCLPCSYSSIAEYGRCTAILGSGGCGKSVLMRHLMFDSLIGGRLFPVFVELRGLNESGQTLLSSILERCHLDGLNIEQKVLESLLTNGRVVLFLDGYDEIQQDRRDEISRQIDKLADKFRELPIIISSRPDYIFTGWSRFAEFEVQPLSLKQACSLVRRLNLDQGLQESFEKSLAETLYHRHESFASNPLLLTIMLLTYGQNAEIPEKLSVFYSYAYEALFHRHDAITKGGWRRQRATTLDIQDFEKALQTFCIQTYDLEMRSFTEGRARDFAKNASTLSAIEFDPAGFVTDCKQAVCMFIDEGLFLTYAHRSFEEYFAASFICSLHGDEASKIIKRFLPRVITDRTMKLIYEISPDLFFEHAWLPVVRDVYAAIGAKVSLTSRAYRKLIRRWIGLIHVRDGHVSAISHSRHTWELPLVQIGLGSDDKTFGGSFLFGRRIDLDSIPIRAISDDDVDDDTYQIDLSKIPLTHKLFDELELNNSVLGREKLSRISAIRNSYERRIATKTSNLIEILDAPRRSRGSIRTRR